LTSARADFIIVFDKYRRSQGSLLYL